MPMGDCRPADHRAHAQRRIDEGRRGLGTGAGERGDYAGDDARTTRCVQRNMRGNPCLQPPPSRWDERGTITLTT